MNFNLNKIPTIKRMVDEKQVELPHIIDYPISQYIAEQIEQRVSNANPLLEYRIAQSLRNTGSVDLNEEETAYLSEIITQLPIDNLLKGQILEVLNPPS
jgi:hypothetical protein